MKFTYLMSGSGMIYGLYRENKKKLIRDNEDKLVFKYILYTGVCYGILGFIWPMTIPCIIIEKFSLRDKI